LQDNGRSSSSSGGLLSMASDSLESLLEALEDRASTARTIFMLLDSDADGLVAVEQLSAMLTSMLLSQSLNYEGDVDEFVIHTARHRHLTKVTYSDFVDIYNALVDRIKLRAIMNGTLAAPAPPAGAARVAAEALRSARPAMGLCRHPGGGDSVASSTPLQSRPIGRRNGSGSAYLVSGAALKGVNGVYTQNGESDGVPKYTYTGGGGVQYCLLRRFLSGGRYWVICESGAQSSATAVAASPAAPRSFFCLRSNAGTPPLEVPWERSRDGLLPGPFLTPISLTHAPPTSVLAPLARCIQTLQLRSSLV